jgi:anti-anti-sigma factor
MPVQQWSDDTLVVTLSDDPILSEDLADANHRLGAGPCDVVLDLAGVALLTSSGISKLLRLRKRQIETGRRLILAALQDSVWSVFLATGLDSIFEFADSVSEALTRLQGGKT